MNGIHLIADLHACQCPPDLLLDPRTLAGLCLEACQRYGFTVVGQVFHGFSDPKGGPAGVTGAVVLAESHLTIHSWPEIACVTLDLYVCNFSGDNSRAAQALFDELTNIFFPGTRQVVSVQRGRPGGENGLRAAVEAITNP